MTTPPSVEADLGWALGTVMRSYMKLSAEAVGDVPGGPRGYQVLATAAKGGASSQLAIAQHLGIDRTMLTYLIDDLEEAGLVERKPDPADRRARRILITQRGGELACELERRLRAAESALLGPLEDAERDVLRALLHRLATGEPDTRVGDLCSVAEHLAAEDAAPAAGRSRRRRT